MIYVCYLFNHISCEALDGQILYGVSPDISIILLQTFYQPVCYATHIFSLLLVRKKQAAIWVGFGKHGSDAIIHTLSWSWELYVQNSWSQTHLFITYTLN